MKRFLFNTIIWFLSMTLSFILFSLVPYLLTIYVSHGFKWIFYISSIFTGYYGWDAFHNFKIKKPRQINYHYKNK